MLERLCHGDVSHLLEAGVRTIDGTRVFSRHAVRPGAPVVVLVHGVGVSSRYLVPAATWLAGRCSVHVPDLPGFGHSGRPRRRPTVPRLAGALEAWLDALGVGRVDLLVGHSFGCQVVAELASRRPGLARGLVLAGPTADPRAPLPLLAGRLALDLLREPPCLVALAAADYLRHLRKSGLAAFRALECDPLRAKLAQVPAPTLVVRGARDPICTPRWAAEVAAALPDGRVRELEDAPHALHYADPEAFAAIVLEHLDLLEAAAVRPAA